MLIFGGILFAAVTAYACCVVSGMCSEDEHMQWTDEGDE